MKIKNWQWVAFMFVCILLICVPIQAVYAGATRITAEVPERPEDTEYPPEPGSDTEWKGDDEDGLSVKVTEELGEIQEVIVDGKSLDKGDYTVSGKPPVITIKPEFLETLKDGKHTVLIRGEKGYTEVTITIKKRSSHTTPAKDPDKAAVQTPEKAASAGAVRTGDETNLALWIFLAVMAGAVLTAVGIRFIQNKKHRTP